MRFSEYWDRITLKENFVVVYPNGAISTRLTYPHAVYLKKYYGGKVNYIKQ